MQISGVTIQGGMYILPRTGAPSPTPGPSDPNFSDVVFMFDGDGTNGGANNTFTDSSTNGFTVTESGSVVQGSFSPYGDNWSNYFDGTSDLLEVADPSSLFELTGDFTVEFWFMRLGGNSTYTPILGIQPTNGQAGLRIAYQSPGTTFRLISGNGTYYVNIGTSTAPPLEKWAHFAMTRSGSSVKAFIDGTEVGSETNSGWAGTSLSLFIGGGRNASSGVLDEIPGYYSNVRVVEGTAVYTSAFTPPTAPLSDITNTAFLGCTSNQFKDISSNNTDVSVHGGTPKVTRFSPFESNKPYDITTDGGSGYFGGGRDYLSLPSSTDFAFGTGDFTIEHWVFAGTQSDAYPRTVAIGPTYSTGSIGTTFDDDDEPGKICFYARSLLNGRILVSTSDVNDNAWHHVAITRSLGVFRLFVDGVLEDTNSSYTGSSVGTTAQSCVIGSVFSEISGEDFQGYISDLRMIKGTALYTSSFTPPTAPPTAVTNTKLLLNFQDAGIYDLSGINNLDTVGNAQIDTSVKKYGTGSIEFDGSGDYLKTSGNEALKLGSGDWTLEFWVYFNAVNDGQVRFLFDWRTSTDTSNSFLAQESSNAWTYWNGAGSGITSGLTSSTFNTSTWHHVAISRDGSTTRFFVDGTNVGSPSDSSNYNSGTLVIGSRYNGQAYLDGYIDDLRITKGVARYTSNFTAPAAALPKF